MDIMKAYKIIFEDEIKCKMHKISTAINDEMYKMFSDLMLEECNRARKGIDVNNTPFPVVISIIIKTENIPEKEV